MNAGGSSNNLAFSTWIATVVVPFASASTLRNNLFVMEKAASSYGSILLAIVTHRCSGIPQTWSAATSLFLFCALVVVLICRTASRSSACVVRDRRKHVTFFFRTENAQKVLVGWGLYVKPCLSYTRLGKVTLHHENRIAQFCQSSAKVLPR